MAFTWTKQRVLDYVALLQSGRFKFPSEALGALAQSLKVDKISARGARRACKRQTGLSPSAFFTPCSRVAQKGTASCDYDTSAHTGYMEHMVRLARGKGSVTIEDLCNELGLRPRRVRKLIDEAHEEGYTIAVRDDRLVDAGMELRTTRKEVIVAPVNGVVKFAAVSDLHFGSRYQMLNAYHAFMERAIEWGAQFTVNCGDTLDGHKMYRGQELELTHHGLEDQLSCAVESIPFIPDHTHYMIDGNHDGSFWKASGQQPGMLLAAAREDVVFLGPRSAQLSISVDGSDEDLVIELFHPQKAGARGKTYHIQNYLAAMQSGLKPDIFLIGHEHQWVQMEERNVWAAKVPCFQSQTPYMVERYMQPSIGGLMIEVGLTKRGTVREIHPRFWKYYGNE